MKTRTLIAAVVEVLLRLIVTEVILVIAGGVIYALRLETVGKVVLLVITLPIALIVGNIITKKPVAAILRAQKYNAKTTTEIKTAAENSDIEVSRGYENVSHPAIDSAFLTILQKIVAERGSSILENHAKCKSLLQDFTAGEYKKESHILLVAIQAGCPGEIARSNEPEITRGKLINKLHNEFSMDKIAVEQIVQLLYSIYTG